ncbi:MAG: tetratricopeptide repeat protein [Rubrivivax sp.]|nr:tetratricopeptide repeat protein [Rubrivivax sp.]
MIPIDTLGHPCSGATPRALELFEQACQDLRCYVGDPLALAQQALAEAPRMTMAHVLVAWLNLLGTEPAGREAARDAVAAAKRLPADEREAAHVAAADAVVQGRWHEAGVILEDLSVRHPRDLLALQAGHQIDFFTGHSRMLRDRIARAETAWHPGMPGHHAVMGMLAFGLEECGQYRLAQQLGEQAVELEPRDGWAWHAVAHVLEMQNRRRDGRLWLRRNPAAWSEGSFLAVHNWWHLALFHLGLDEIDEVLKLADGPVLGGASSVVLEMIDASALLWRLQLRGVDVGNRWQALAGRWAPQVQQSQYAFNDLHAMMAFVGAGRDGDAEALLAAQQRALAAGDDNVGFLRDVGHDATRAVLAFGRGRFDEAVDLLRPLRSRAHRFGGSHAQRDLIDLTLIEAATRGGQRQLAEALRHERAVARR